MSKTYNLFISHSWAYGDEYERLKSLLDNRLYFNYLDYSIPSYDPVHCASETELTNAIYYRMRLCHIVLIVAGVYSTYSKWINNEIIVAKSKFNTPKPILAIRPLGNINVSSVVAKNADDMVGWNTESVVDGIRRLAL